MTADVVVAEGVWASPFAALAQRRSVLRLPDDADVAATLHTARALVVRNRTKVTRELLEAAPRLQLVGRAGVGLDNVDVAAADELGVVVSAALGANAVSVAEHAVGLALAVARRIAELDASTKAGRWDRMPGRELAGGVWGLLSAGATARATGRLARALGMSVVAYDPHLPADDPELAASGIVLRPLDEVVASADVLSLHLPATPDTAGLLDRRLLRLAKPSLIVVNVGRGETVDEDALADALATAEIAGAALDVRRQEPPIPGRLEALPTVVLTPHVAGMTAQAQDRIAAMLCEDIEAVLNGGRVRHAVTRADRPNRTVTA